MTHMRSMHESEGTFGEWQPADRPCRRAGCEGLVRCRLWTSHDEAYEDWQYQCTSCDTTWWIEGPDS